MNDNDNKNKPQADTIKEKTSVIRKKFHAMPAKDKSLLVKLSACLLIGIVLLGISGMKEDSDKDTPVAAKASDTSGEYISYTQQEQLLEEKLAHILSQVKGAGEVSVAITLEEGPEAVYATDTDQETTDTQNQSSSQLTEINDEPVLIKENPAKVRGVVIVASGAGDPLVQENLLQAAASLLGVRSSQVAVMEKESIG